MQEGLSKEQIWALLSPQEREIIAGGCKILPDKIWLLTRIGQALPTVGLKSPIIKELFKNISKFNLSEESKWLISFYYDYFLKL